MSSMLNHQWAMPTPRTSLARHRAAACQLHAEALGRYSERGATPQA
eukprot:CAMPEP_0185559754 /NCGR_PEP_ID=MMETSP1381-20130426/55306_1 /TAXON_ID=298111 /ORGANISM="Pavlova sp., Strain CCMP459" /LENGTH=45 /DNA_ID= /DNA_START= /DNA_END= /DNA_ORIENTATION=